MENINKVELCGYVGSVDIEKTDSTKWTKFTLATSIHYSKEGTMYHETTWHNIVAFQNSSKQDLSAITKGCGIHLTGRIRTNKYTGQDGKERTVNEILALSLEIVKESKSAAQTESKNQ